MHPDKINDFYTDYSDRDSDKRPEENGAPLSARTSNEQDTSKTTINFDTPTGPEATSTTPPIGPAPQKKSHAFRKFLIWLTVIAAIALTAVIYIRYFNPYVTDAKVTGYITNIERRGIIFKTYEGEMISQQKLTDPNHIYSRDFFFTVPNDSLAKSLQEYQGSGRQVTLTYDRYWGVLPWRGGSTIVITAIEQPSNSQ